MKLIKNNSSFKDCYVKVIDKKVIYPRGLMAFIELDTLL